MTTDRSTPLRALVLTILIAVGASAVANAQSSPSGLLDAVTIRGFTIDDDPSLPSHDMTWSELSSLTGVTVDVDATDEEVASFRAAIRSWYGDDGDVLIVMASTMGDAGLATDIVNGAIDSSRVSGTEIEPPFDHAASFSCIVDDDAGMTLVVWRQGTFAMTVSHFAVGSGPDPQVTNTVADQIELAIRDRIGESPAGPPAGSTRTDSGVAYRIGRTLGPLLFAPLIVVPIVLIRRRRRRRSAIVQSQTSPPPWPPPPPVAWQPTRSSAGQRSDRAID